jgi:hypothetical protein
MKHFNNGQTQFYQSHERTMMRHIQHLSDENGCTNVVLDYLGNTSNSDTWKYELYQDYPEYTEMIEFGEITITS